MNLEIWYGALGIEADSLSDYYRPYIIPEYSLALADGADEEARADVARRVQRCDALAAALRDERASRRTTRAQAASLRADHADDLEAVRALDLDIERATAELAAVRGALQQQTLSQEQRARLLDDVDYARRVHDSKTALAEQIAKVGRYLFILILRPYAGTCLVTNAGQLKC